MNKVKQLKNTAPGYENISNKMIKEFKYELIVKLTEHLNNMWFDKIMPSSWKIFKVI